MAPKTAKKQGFVMTVNKFKLSEDEQNRIREVFVEFELKTNSTAKIAELSDELNVSKTNVQQFISFLRKQNYDGEAESLAHSNERILRILHEQFQLNPFLAKGKRAQELARELGVKVRRVTDYFQKRRDKLKQQNGQKAKPRSTCQPRTTTRHVKSNRLDDDEKENEELSDIESESGDEEYVPPKYYITATRKRALRTTSLQPSPANRAQTNTPSPQNLSRNIDDEDIAQIPQSPDNSVPPSPRPEAQNNLDNEQVDERVFDDNYDDLGDRRSPTPPEAENPQRQNMQTQNLENVVQEIPSNDVIVKKEIKEELMDYEHGDQDAENMEIDQSVPVHKLLTRDPQDWMLGCEGNLLGRCWFPKCTEIKELQENQRELAENEEPVLEVQGCDSKIEHFHKMRVRHGLLKRLIQEEIDEIFTLNQPNEDGKSLFNRVIILTDWRLLHLNTRMVGNATVKFLPTRLGFEFFERLAHLLNEVITGKFYEKIVFAFGGSRCFTSTDFKKFWNQFTAQARGRIRVCWIAQDWTDGLEVSRKRQRELNAFNKFVKNQVQRTTNENGYVNYKFVNIRQQFNLPMQKIMDDSIDNSIDTTPLEVLYKGYFKYFGEETKKKSSSNDYEWMLD